MSIETTQTQIVAVAENAIHIVTAGIPGTAGATGATGATGTAGVGVPTGGSTGQVLKKLSATNYDTAWQNESSGGTPAGSSGQLQFNNSSAFGGAAASAYATSGTHLTLTAQTATDKAFAVKGAASQTANLMEFRDSSDTAFLYVGAPTLAGDDADKNFVKLTATMPSTMTAQTNAVKFDITTAGSSAQQQNGMVLNLNSGYTGGSPVNSLQISNSVAGTGAGYGSGSASNCYRTSNSNVGVRSAVNGSTSGINNGGQLSAQGSSTANYGNWCTATSSQNSPALNVGVAATALNATVNCAGFFSLTASGTPSIANSAVIMDNGATSADVMQARVNGTSVVKIDSVGRLFPLQATTAGSPSYVKGAIYFDTTLNKLRIGGASAWETVTSS